MKYTIAAFAAGFILDLIFGDPRWLYHPVCLIGNAIAFLEKRIRKLFPKTEKGELLGGILEVLLICLFSCGVPFLILYGLYHVCVPAAFRAASGVRAGSFSSGNLLVLSASCHKVVKNRKHEGV